MGFTSKYTGSQVEAKLDAVENKQDRLVSGTNIKTINGEDILGEGDIAIGGGGDTEELELVTAAAITDLDSRIKGLVSKDNSIQANITSIEGDITTLQNTKATKTEVNEADDNIIGEIEDNEKVTAAALNEMWLKLEDVIARLTALENK